MSRFAMLAVTLSLVLTLPGNPLFAQAEAKKDEPKAESTKKDEPKAETPVEPKKDEPKKDEVKKDEPKKEEAKKEEAKKDEPKKEEALKPIPPEVEKKLDAARRAVAEAIVAAQDAGLVNSSIDPPPILDILITGRATDDSTLKARTGVSPEVFGAWFTGYGKTQGIVPQNDVRIIQPSAGLTAWYGQRAALLNREIDAVRKANAPAKAAEEPKKDEPKAENKKEEPKKDEPKAENKKEEPKKDEPKAENKKEEPKAETKKEEADAKKEEPKAEAKKDEPKAETKKEEAKDEPKKEEAKKEEPKKEEPK